MYISTGIDADVVNSVADGGWVVRAAKVPVVLITPVGVMSSSGWRSGATVPMC